MLRHYLEFEQRYVARLHHSHAVAFRRLGLVIVQLIALLADVPPQLSAEVSAVSVGIASLRLEAELLSLHTLPVEVEILRLP